MLIIFLKTVLKLRHSLLIFLKERNVLQTNSCPVVPHGREIIKVGTRRHTGLYRISEQVQTSHGFIKHYVDVGASSRRPRSVISGSSTAQFRSLNAQLPIYMKAFAV